MYGRWINTFSWRHAIDIARKSFCFITNSIHDDEWKREDERKNFRQLFWLTSCCYQIQSKKFPPRGLICSQLDSRFFLDFVSASLFFPISLRVRRWEIFGNYHGYNWIWAQFTIFLNHCRLVSDWNVPANASIKIIFNRFMGNVEYPQNLKIRAFWFYAV